LRPALHQLDGSLQTRFCLLIDEIFILYDDEESMNDLIHYFAPTKDSAVSLGMMARQAFSDTFAHLYDPEFVCSISGRSL
jgi:hypothetical protein